MATRELPLGAHYPGCPSVYVVVAAQPRVFYIEMTGSCHLVCVFSPIIITKRKIKSNDDLGISLSVNDGVGAKLLTINEHSNIVFLGVVGLPTGDREIRTLRFV